MTILHVVFYNGTAATKFVKNLANIAIHLWTIFPILDPPINIVIFLS